MSTPNQNPRNVVTGKCRLSYSHIFEAAAINDVGDPKFSACIIVSKNDTETLAKLKAAMEAAVAEGIKTKWKGKRPPNLKLPLRDGDTERPDDENFAGCYFLNANAKNRPGVVDLNLNPILDTTEVYSGCYCRFAISFYPFSASGNNGVAVGLNNVQKVADGTPLGGRNRAEVDFNDGYLDGIDDLL